MREITYNKTYLQKVLTGRSFNKTAPYCEKNILFHPECLAKDCLSICQRKETESFIAFVIVHGIFENNRMRNKK